MQRINENTYIDDTLVTCAEYQLFIDEMREKGKNFQPDHWTSYQFPEGQAREPILGVRHADATAFCQWLTGKNAEGWAFRLATQEEADKLPVKAPGNEPLGYWLKDAYQFAWIRSVSKDMIAHERDLELTRVHAIERVINQKLDLALNCELDRNRARARNLDRASDRALALDLDRELDCDRTIEIDRALELARTRARNRARERELVEAIDRELDRNLVEAIDRANARGRAHGLDRARDRALASAIDIYLQLFLMDERISGRYPAYEGIRLVKERTG